MKEIPQPEFRQVRFQKWVHDQFLYYYKIQQKFLIPNGESYWACEKRNALDTAIAGTLASTKWQPMKEEWRYLPEIDSEEINAKYR